MSPCILLLCATTASAQPAADPDLVYRVTRTFSDSGAILQESVEGPLTVWTGEGEEYVDPVDLLDSDGNSYTFEAVVNGYDESQPTITTVSLRRSQDRELTDAELEEIWLRTHPRSDVSALWERRSANRVAVEPPTVVVPALEAWRSTAAADETVSAIVALRAPPPSTCHAPLGSARSTRSPPST
jgi:hypothetical protein